MILAFRDENLVLPAKVEQIIIFMKMSRECQHSHETHRHNFVVEVVLAVMHTQCRYETGRQDYHQ